MKECSFYFLKTQIRPCKQSLKFFWSELNGAKWVHLNFARLKAESPHFAHKKNMLQGSYFAIFGILPQNWYHQRLILNKITTLIKHWRSKLHVLPDIFEKSSFETYFIFFCFKKGLRINRTRWGLVEFWEEITPLGVQTSLLLGYSFIELHLFGAEGGENLFGL